jgi:hypothetical protein
MGEHKAKILWRLGENLPPDHVCRANLPLIVAHADRLKNWIAAIIHRVVGYNFSCTRVRDLFAKLERDFVRVQRDSLDSDAAFNFFVTAYHLLDWVHPGYANKSKRQVIENGCELLQIVSHIANGSKHFVAEAARHKSVVNTGSRGAFDSHVFDKNVFDVAELVVYPDGEAARIFGSRVRVIELANQLVEYWRRELA